VQPSPNHFGLLLPFELGSGVWRAVVCTHCSFTVVCGGILVKDMVTCTCHLPSRSRLTRHFFSTLLYVAETWTVHSEDSRTFESFDMKCQHQMLSIRWQDHIHSVKIANQSGLLPVMDHIVKYRNLFLVLSPGCRDVPVHRALCCQVDLSSCCFPDRSWTCWSGRPQKCWLDHIRDDIQHLPANMWRDAVRRGRRRVMQLSSVTALMTSFPSTSVTSSETALQYLCYCSHYAAVRTRIWVKPYQHPSEVSPEIFNIFTEISIVPW